MQTRKATLNDIPTLLAFEQAVITTERPFDPTLAAGTIHYYDIREMILADHVEILVAEIDSKIVACGYARIEKSKPYLQHNGHAYLGFMFVHPEFRGQGLNAKIITALKEWVVSKGITELRLEVYFDNLSAIAAYEKMGFQKLLIEMRASC
ncbi:MAG: GNAT family N-acetyltransferase [Ferruginibacter sp.]